jgi:hypothetical protein
LDSKKGNDKKVVKPLNSVHVIHYSCSNCGDEEEYAKLCSSCKAPMRVIQVVELYGEEADEYLEKLNQKEESSKKKENSGGVQYDDSVLGMSEEEDFESDEGKSDVDDVALGDIFPDEEGKKNYVDDLGDDFEAALDILDQEEDDEDIEDLPEL